MSKIDDSLLRKKRQKSQHTIYREKRPKFQSKFAAAAAQPESLESVDETDSATLALPPLPLLGTLLAGAKLPARPGVGLAVRNELARCP